MCVGEDFDTIAKSIQSVITRASKEDDIDVIRSDVGD